MLKSHLITAWRNIRRNPVFSFINIAGLALGLAVCMLIVEYVLHEYSYDGFHANAGRICWVQTKVKLNGDSFFTSAIDYKLATLVRERLPVAEGMIRTKKEDADAIIQNIGHPTLKFAEPRFIFADSNFFSFFNFRLLRGNKAVALQNPLSVVISQKASEKYFGHENPVGKILRYNNTIDLMVSGVSENPPSNSSINYDFVAPIAALMAINHVKDTLPENESNFTTYFLLRNAADASRLEASLQQLDKAKQATSGVPIRYMAIPLTSTHLNSFSDNSPNTKYLKVFPFVAGLILLLALVNYMSLATARATTRAKEIGVRKVMGAARKTIALQFFAESALHTAISFLLAYILCVVLQPAFFRFLQIDIDHSFLYRPFVLLSFGGLFVISAILAATYPSFLLSAYKPILVLYGKFNNQSSSISVRKLFTIFQFTMSAVLVICAFIINKQLFFFTHTNTGVNRSNIVMVPFSNQVGKHYPAFKKDNQGIATIAQVSVAEYAMYNGYDVNVIKPRSGDGFITYSHLAVDENFISMLGLQWKDAPENPLYYRQESAFIINEAAAGKFGLGPNPVNKSVEGAFTVSGVLKDFNYESLQNKIGPIVISFIKDDDSAGLWAQNGGCFFAKIKPHANMADLLQEMKIIYTKYDTEKPFEYYFMDDTFNTLYKAEDRLSKVFAVFTSFTLFIACLGLFGLSLFMAVQRTKEIGIRKVLGASVSNITILLSKDFAKLVIVSVILASPIAWWVMSNWLQGFAFRTIIGWRVFVATGAAAVFIALATVGYHAVRAAIANPVKSLRAE